MGKPKCIDCRKKAKHCLESETPRCDTCELRWNLTRREKGLPAFERGMPRQRQKRRTAA